MNQKERDAMSQLANDWAFRFKDAMVHKADKTKRWQTYWDAYFGRYFENTSLPDYKSNLVSNYIFSIIETIRPIMLDNDPKFQAMPRQPLGIDFTNDVQEALSYEWDRESMNVKLFRDLITTLVTGTSVYFLPWNGQDKNVNAVSVSPYNIYPDPLATSVEDAEFIIYASYKNEVVLQRLFPKMRHLLKGGDINYGELVHDNNKNTRVDNQILVLEVWTRDYETVEKDEKGDEKVKYPNGRVLTIAPELGLVLSDKANPYQDKDFPFILIKDYDVPGEFWGEGEVAQLISPQKYMNELNNAILDNAKTTANMPWIVDKNSGIAQGKITSRPGLVIRKNPGTQVDRLQPPSMPNYVVNAVETYKADMEQVSGVFDTLKGNSETGVYTAQGVLALQEAGQARIRLKVKLLEDSLGKLANMWFSRLKQFWKEDRFIRITSFEGQYDLKKFMTSTLDYDYDIKIMAGSTMPVNRGAMLDLMIRLAQTQMPDGQALVDREAVSVYLPQEVRTSMLQRMQAGNVQLQQLQQSVEQITEQLQQLAQESKGNDDQTMQTIEQLMGALETINKQILQIKQENARLEEERAKEEERQSIESKSFNEGYAEAEKNFSAQSDALSMDEPLEKGMPDDVLGGLESLGDEELSLILQQNPELAELLK